MGNVKQKVVFWSNQDRVIRTDTHVTSSSAAESGQEAGLCWLATYWISPFFFFFQEDEKVNVRPGRFISAQVLAS